MIIKEYIKKALSAGLHCDRLFQRMCEDLIFIFNYHEINDNPSMFSQEFGLNVPPSLFLQQLKWIKQYFNVISPTQLLGNDYDLPAALITFDDGYASTFEKAAPILYSNRLPATVFINMAPVEGAIFWSGLVTYLCYHDKAFEGYMLKQFNKADCNLHLYCRQEEVDEYISRNDTQKIYKAARAYYGAFGNLGHLRTSSDYGLFLGNHLYNHHNAIILTPDELRNSYITNENNLKEYSNFVNLFSYPFGQPETCYNAQTDDIIFLMGAKKVFSAYAYPNKDPQSRRLHRLSMFDNIKDDLSFRYNRFIYNWKKN